MWRYVWNVERCNWGSEWSDSDSGGSWDPVTGCQAWSLPPDDNLSSDWLLSPHLWLAPGTRPLIGPLSLDLVTVSTPWTLGQNLKLIHFVGDAVYYYGFIFVVRGVPSFSVWYVTGGYVLYQIRLLPFSRVISHNILIIVNLSTLSFESVKFKQY